MKMSNTWGPFSVIYLRWVPIKYHPHKYVSLRSPLYVFLIIIFCGKSRFISLLSQAPPNLRRSTSVRTPCCQVDTYSGK